MPQTNGTQNLPTDAAGETHLGLRNPTDNTYSTPPGDTVYGTDVDVRRNAHGAKTMGKVTVNSGTATLVRAANANRVSLTFWQLETEAQSAFYLGKDSSLTASNGLYVSALSVTDTDSNDDWWVFQASGGALTVLYIETVGS